MAARVEVVTNLVRAWSLADEWDALADRLGAAAVTRPAYALSWWERLGRGRLLVVTERDDTGQLVALAPLHERSLGPVRVVRWLGHGLGTVASALVPADRPEVGCALWDAVRAPGRVLQLTETEEGTAGLAALQSAQHRPGRECRVAPRDVCPTVRVTGPLAEHLAGGRRKNTRRAVRRAQRRADDAGLVHRVAVAETREQVVSLLPDARRVFDASEAAHPRQHFFAGELAEFTLDVLHRSVERAGAVVLVGYLDERPVSTYVWLCAGRTWQGWLSRFDPDAARYGPGHLILAAGYDLAHERGVECLDLGVGDFRYKHGWSDGSYATLDVVAGSTAAVTVASPALRILERRHGRTDTHSDGSDRHEHGSDHPQRDDTGPASSAPSASPHSQAASR